MSGCEVVLSQFPLRACEQPVAYDVDLAPFRDDRHGWVCLCAEHTASLRREEADSGVILSLRTHMGGAR